MIHPSHLMGEVIIPVLDDLDRAKPGMKKPGALFLLLGTAAQESDMGFFLRQHPQGPARGAWQMEKATADDYQYRYLEKDGNEALKAVVYSYAVPGLTFYEQLSWNLKLACALARIRYWAVPVPIPTSLEGQARYWDVYYNANEEDEIQAYLDSWEDFVEPYVTGPANPEQS